MELKRRKQAVKNRRQQLIDATIHCIAENGLSDITLSKVATKAGLTAGIVNFYFKSKKQLLLDTLSYLDDEYCSVAEQYLAVAETSQQKLNAYIQASFDERIFTKEKIAVWYAFSSESQARSDYKQICDDNYLNDRQIIRDSFADLMPNAVNSNHDTETLALGLEGIVEKFWQQALYSTDGIDRQHAINTCLRYLKLIFPQSTELECETNSLEFSKLLPPWTYQNEELLDLEIDKLFKPNWMLAGHVSEMPSLGCYLTFEGFNEKALIIRDGNGNINAFHNICRHRGSKILNGEGQCKRALICPFHGWRYDFDGTLQFIPGQSGFPDVDKAEHGLVPIDVEVWNGFIFIRFISGGISVSEMLQPISSEIEEYKPEDLQPYSEVDQYVYPVNWKIFHDIDNEGYHVPIGHPTLHQLYGQNYTDTYVNGIPVSRGRFNDRIGNLWSVRNYRNLMNEFEHLASDKQNLWNYYGVFPNLVFAFYPEMMETYMAVPISLNQTQVISRVYALPDSRREVKALRYLNRRINRVTELEDRTYMITLQEGLKSSAYPQWNLSNSAETGVEFFHRRVQDELPVARLLQQPDPETVRGFNSQLAAAPRRQNH